MQRYFLSIKGFLVFAAALAALLFVAGCGSSGSSATGSETSDTTSKTIVVETGSLSKEQFIQQAGVICLKSRAQFDGEYEDLLKNAQPANSPKELKVLFGGVVDTLLSPIYEKLIDEISALGAPTGGEAKVAAFLNTMQNRLASMQKNPAELGETLTPFKPAEKLASAYGMTGCANSLT
jgi:hypothetical protein